MHEPRDEGPPRGGDGRPVELALVRISQYSRCPSTESAAAEPADTESAAAEPADRGCADAEPADTQSADPRSSGFREGIESHGATQ